MDRGEGGAQYGLSGHQGLIVTNVILGHPARDEALFEAGAHFAAANLEAKICSCCRGPPRARPSLGSLYHRYGRMFEW